MAYHAEWPSGKIIKFRLGVAVVVLSETEVRGLLARDLDLYGQALLRGKACRRRSEFRKRTTSQKPKEAT